jgi:hypothetical protein
MALGVLIVTAGVLRVRSGRINRFCHLRGPKGSFMASPWAFIVRIYIAPVGVPVFGFLGLLGLSFTGRQSVINKEATNSVFTLLHIKKRVDISLVPLSHYKCKEHADDDEDDALCTLLQLSKS